jgi:hypothetical protein
MGDAHVFSKRAWTVKSWLPLIETNLSIASFAINAISAATNKRNCYPIANFPVPHIRADFRNNTREFMAWDMRQLGYVRIMPLPAMPITAAKPSGFNLDNHAMRPGNRQIPLGDI